MRKYLKTGMGKIVIQRLATQKPNVGFVVPGKFSGGDKRTSTGFTAGDIF